MKTHFMQVSLGLLSVVLLSACTTIQPLTSPATESTLLVPSSTSMQVLPTATVTQPAQLSPAPTHLAATSLCPPATADVAWECRESAPDSTRICSATAAFDAVWRCYEDLDFGFALALPPDMQTAISINTPASDPVVIQRRHTLSHPLMGGIDMDIWLTAEADLAAWLEQMYRSTGPELFPLLEPNATVGGHPAVVYIMGPDSPETLLTVVFSDGTYVYRFWHTLFCSTDTLEMVRRVLDSIRFAPDPIPAELPEDVWQQALRICAQE